jgi:hypothetical protein
VRSKPEILVGVVSNDVLAISWIYSKRDGRL